MRGTTWVTHTPLEAFAMQLAFMHLAPEENPGKNKDQPLSGEEFMDAADPNFDMPKPLNRRPGGAKPKEAVLWFNFSTPIRRKAVHSRVPS